MNLGDVILFAVIGVMAGNHLVMRLPGWQRRLWLFWLFQGLNLGIIIFLLVRGIPSLEGPLVVFNYVFALLMMMRVVQNNNRMTAARAEGTEEEKETASAKQQALKAALARGRDTEDQQSQ